LRLEHKAILACGSMVLCVFVGDFSPCRAKNHLQEEKSVRRAAGKRKDHMEILGLGPGEFFLILIVLLVVVGPERLPGLARQAGQFLVRARNWLQTSPDAALVLRARAEIEAELASIKNSLMEVQVVRDEVMGAAKQLGDSVNAITPPKLDLNSMINPATEPTITANGQAVAGGESPALMLPNGTAAAGTPLDQRSTLELPNGSSAPTQLPAEAPATNGLSGLAHVSSGSAPAIASSTAPALGELESINIRLQAIMADMWALQQQLKQRGALDQTWQPPSLDVQLPTPETAAPADPPSPAEPAEDPAVLEARKRLEQLTPMRVAVHAPPALEEAPADSAPVAIVIPEADASLELAAPAEPPVAKARKRRAAASADQIATEAAAAPANGAPGVKTRKRRTPAASAGETEPITTEKAS
jgi:sec-independent protein translocase protein TatB